MPSIEKRGRHRQVRWYARFRDPAGEQNVKVFDRRVDAERILTTVESAKLTGTHVDAKRAAISSRIFSEEHWAAYSPTLAADTTRVRKRSVLDRHILPTPGRHSVGANKPSTVASALGCSQTLAPGTVGQLLRQLRQILDAALADGLVAANAAKSVKGPPAPRRHEVRLTDEHVAMVVAAAPAAHRAPVITHVVTGLRISEACRLRVDAVDFRRRTIQVRRQRRPGGNFGRLKTGSPRRDFPADDSVLRALAEEIRVRPRRDGLIFSGNSGGALSKAMAGHEFDASERQVGLTVSPHSLRDYFGASLISRGVSVVAIAHWLGHSSPETTYRVYAYLKPDDEQAGRDAIAETMRYVIPHVYPLCTREGSE